MILKSRSRQLWIRVCKMVIVLLAVSTICVSLCCCGMSDWQYDLPNSYYVVRTNYSTIFINYKNEKGLSEPAVPPEKYVSYFAYNDTYIVAQTITLPEKIEPDEIELLLKHAKVAYYIVNSETQEVYEELTWEEYEALMNELQITNLCDWIPTITKPKGAWT